MISIQFVGLLVIAAACSGPMSGVGVSMAGSWEMVAQTREHAAPRGDNANPSNQPTTSAAPVPVRFLILIPQDADLAPEAVYCSLSTDSWPAGGRAAQRIAEGVYQLSLSLPPGPLEYKIIREKRWETVEKDEQGGERPNRLLVVKADGNEQVEVVPVARWADRPAAKTRRVSMSGAQSAMPATRPSSRTGDIRVHERVHSPQFGDDRTVLVYLPPAYEQSKERYPVLYMHDGENVFDAATSFGGAEWGVDEACEKLIAAGKLKPQIVVAIYNTARRMDEYTPWKDEQHGGGRGDEYLDFVIHTVKPLIDQSYRTLSDRDHTAVAGSSLGGLISLYALSKHPDVFSAAGVESPALFWARGQALEFVRTAEIRRPIRIWIAIGTEEGEKSGPLESFTRAVEDCRTLAKLLEEKGLKPEQEFRLEIVPGGKHNERDWAARVEKMLGYLCSSSP